MSKISLQPNASGAGTFSIVAPDSNTNRTLTLPDESGAVLSDSSTIDSNNLQPDVYKQDNIVGTVSQSSGVPTGAIIQRGSNGNGEFVRYADGTQICTFRTASPGPYPIDVTFPADFITHPVSVVSLRTGSAATAIVTSITSSSASFLRIRHILNSSGSSMSGTNVGFSYVSTGRWF